MTFLKGKALTTYVWDSIWRDEQAVPSYCLFFEAVGGEANCPGQQCCGYDCWVHVFGGGLYFSFSIKFCFCLLFKSFSQLCIKKHFFLILRVLCVYWEFTRLILSKPSITMFKVIEITVPLLYSVNLSLKYFHGKRQN